ncbi:bifunctional diguanylate cyclase/phosphodiesterase, partial [Patescibacteria group bacterium]|nr:bifunctional diguanylate cyclase/phosphodiesterase [Patescibacteria group bacterium]
QAISTAERSKEMLGVMFLDLDHFKNINDTLGHAIGDQLLQEVAVRLSKSVRKGDTVARLGGDEFTILTPRIKSEADIQKITRQIFKKLHPIFLMDSHPVAIQTSIGVALYPNDGTDVQTLLKNADTALYQAKNEGRNIWKLYNAESNYQSLERLTLESDLGQALDRGEFVLYYQPIYQMGTDQIISLEALVRWNHPNLGIINPNDFIPLAEERGLIIALNEWVLKTACRESRKWQKGGLPPIRISVNISNRQFAQANLADRIKKVLQETGLEAQYLQLEITETFAMRNIDVTVERLKEIKKAGITVSIDDFGSGHSSLNYLKRLPVDILKVDRSFVQECGQDQDRAILEAIITMAHNLNLQVVAEGVENRHQLACLAGLNCDGVQGFLYSEPLPSDRIVELLSQPTLLSQK